MFKPVKVFYIRTPAEAENIVNLMEERKFIGLGSMVIWDRKRWVNLN